jgi:hypothetical protein
VLTCGCHSPSGPEIALPNGPGACDRIWDSAIMAGRAPLVTAPKFVVLAAPWPHDGLAQNVIASDRGDSGVGPGPVRVPGWLAAFWAPVRDEYQARFEQFTAVEHG